VKIGRFEIIQDKDRLFSRDLLVKDKYIPAAQKLQAMLPVFESLDTIM
jgi:hypothetical protein